MTNKGQRENGGTFVIGCQGRQGTRSSSWYIKGCMCVFVVLKLVTKVLVTLFMYRVSQKSVISVNMTITGLGRILKIQVE